MTETQYRNALKRLGLTPYSAGPILGISRRQAQRYAAGDPIPGPIVKLLRLALAGKITLDDIGGA